MSGQESNHLLPIWGVFAGTLVVVLLSIELGYRWARHLRQRWEQTEEQEKEAPVGAMVGATLGLLAFLLAFMFGMAADHYHARKISVLEDANAIHTTYLRAAFIPEPHRSEVRRILREYVDERLQWAGAQREPAARTDLELLDELWAQVAVVGEKHPGLEVVALFVDSANDIIKINRERLMVRERSRIPGALKVVMFLISVFSFAAMGYHGGVAGTIRSPVMVAVAISFSLVMMMIADLDRPGSGFISAGQDAMLDLCNRLPPPGR